MTRSLDIYQYFDAAQVDAISTRSWVYALDALVKGPVLEPSAMFLPETGHTIKPLHVLIREAYPGLYDQCKAEEMQGDTSGQVIVGVPGIGMEALPPYLIKR